MNADKKFLCILINLNKERFSFLIKFSYFQYFSLYSGLKKQPTKCNENYLYYYCINSIIIKRITKISSCQDLQDLHKEQLYSRIHKQHLSFYFIPSCKKNHGKNTACEMNAISYVIIKSTVFARVNDLNQCKATT